MATLAAGPRGPEVQEGEGVKAEDVEEGNLLLECCILQECSYYPSIEPTVLPAVQPSEGLEEKNSSVDNDNEPISGLKENCLSNDYSTPQENVVEEVSQYLSV